MQRYAEAEQFGQLVTAALPDSADEPVPSCEGMVLAELVRHVGSVHRLVADWVRDGRRPTAWMQAPEVGEDLATWAWRGSADMLEILTGPRPSRRYCR